MALVQCDYCGKYYDIGKPFEPNIRPCPFCELDKERFMEDGYDIPLEGIEDEQERERRKIEWDNIQDFKAEAKWDNLTEAKADC